MQPIEIGYQARPQFVPYHMRRTRWSCIVAHRRAGKTVACVADLIDAALSCDKPEGRFAYMAPTYSQAKDVAWGYLKRLTAAIPGVEQRESDLTVNLPNGARIRLYGSDNYDRLRGIYLDGVVLDEAGDMDPRAWPEVIRPALADRQGWATFIGTPKGRNQFYEIWTAAQSNPEWTTLRLRASETGLIPESELKSAATMLTSEQYEAEFECSFDAAVVGAFYGRGLADAEREGRITGVPYDPAAQVWTAWDLGISDTTSIWFAQIVGREIHVIDYYENAGVDLGHYVREIQSKPYLYGGHLLPHDAEARELGTGKTRVEVLQSLGLNPTIVKNHRVEDGINAVRMMLPKCWFDGERTAKGVDALKMYRSEWDDKRQTFNTKPVHDWSSHAADAFRYLAMGLEMNASNSGFSSTRPLRRSIAGVI